MDLISRKAHILQFQPENRHSLLQNSSIVYIISKEWWNSWCNYVGYSDDSTEVSPGPIDNSCLVYGEGYSWDTLQLRQDLDSASDFEILHPVTWKRLLQEYGGGPEVNINVIDGEIDLHPASYEVLFLDSLSVRHNDRGRYHLLSPRLNGKQALESICTSLALSPSNYELQMVYRSEGINKFLDLGEDNTLSEIRHKNARLAVILKEPDIGKQYVAIPMPPVLQDSTPIFSSDEEDMQLAMAIQTSLQNRSIEGELPTSDTESTGII
jgi:hypothetical protein